MDIGIVGLPNVWKSTLFNALTKSYAADAANFPFCTIEPNVGIVDVKDQRLESLSKISWSEKLIYATVRFVDIAWLVKWASQWQWLGNKFLSHIREVDAIVQVVRYFNDADVIHVEWNVDPQRDAEIINTELIFADLEQIESKLPALEKKAKTKDKEAMELFDALSIIKKYLDEWKLAWDCRDQLNDAQIKVLKQFNLLTFKPFVYAVNVSDTDIKDHAQIKSKFEAIFQKPVAIVCAKLEAEMLDLSDEDKALFVADLSDSGDVPTLDDLIKLAFNQVGLMYYFTSWQKETRAWTIRKNSTAPQAAWAIHTDFEKWFIKAEIVGYDHYLKAWSWVKAKEMWFLRLEWKDYIVQDWDVIVFKFNV